MRKNALHNCTNPYQGKSKRVLTVCSAGLLRSPTLANVLHKEFGHNTRSCGVHDYALIQFDEVLGKWADLIVAVNDEVAYYLPDDVKDKLIVLDIPDIYEYMHPELQEICLQQYKETLNG